MIAALLVASAVAAGQDLDLNPNAPTTAETVSAAPVVIDGRTVLYVRGAPSYPSDQRAAAITGRIEVIARDASVALDQIHIVPGDHAADLLAGSRPIMSVLDIDALAEGVGRDTLAIVYARRIRDAIKHYREDRNPEILRRAAWHAVLATIAFLAVLWAVLLLMRKLRAVAAARYSRLANPLAIQSFQILNARHIWTTLATLLRTLTYVSVGLICYLYVQYVLSLFPSTRAVAQRLLSYLLDPLKTMGSAVLGALPDVIFIAVVVIITRYLLRIMRLFFDAVASGGVKLANFEPEWSVPTYRGLRLVVIAFATVVAYPYIPGSQSGAFKGISIFLGIMFSIGSSSFMANLIAGYALTYRRVFKPGDWVKIDDMVGEVMHSRLQVTHLRSLKNEEVIVPNSTILNNQVVNYSSLTRQRGLILHTTVGIGYETPWRAVEAMLLLAAERTPGVQREPAPFVLQKSLGDFSVVYELNAYCTDPAIMFRLYTALHRSILDVFNEYGVQIMTPAYEGDPEQPKLVPKEHWFAAPAVPTEEFSARSKPTAEQRSDRIA